MRFITIIVRNLLQRSTRTAVTVTCVAVAVGGFTVLTELGRGVELAWNTSLVKQGTHLLAYRKGVRDLLTGTIDQRIVDEVRKAPGVDTASAELLDIITLETGTAILVRGWEADSILWRETFLVAGRLPAPDALMEVVIGETLAESLDIKPGGTIMPFGSVLQVVGISRTDNVLSNNSVYIQLAGLQDLLDRGRKITGLHIRVKEGHDEKKLESIRKSLAELFPQILFVTAQRAAQENELYRFWRGMGWAASLVGLIMGLLIVFNTMLVAVLEKTREIGVLSAVGWSGRRILSLIILESLTISTLGCVVGIGLGYLGLNLLVSSPQLKGFVVVAPSCMVLVLHFLVILLIGLGGGFLPALRAVRLKPTEALRDR